MITYDRDCYLSLGGGSGSTCVQTIVGSTGHSSWQSADLDIYCTHDVAPFVRRWLISEDINQVFGGYSEVSNMTTSSTMIEHLIPSL